MISFHYNSLVTAAFGIALAVSSSASTSLPEIQSPAPPEISSSSSTSGISEEMMGRRYPPMKLTKHAESAEYGYSEKIPIAVGGGFSDGSHNVYRYLNA